MIGDLIPPLRRALRGEAWALMALIFNLPRLAMAADVPPTTQLEPIDAHQVQVVDTPESDRAYQHSTPEELVIKILSVKAEKPGFTNPDVGPGSLVVTAQATVVSVIRTVAKAKVGDKITLFYAHILPPAGKNGPLPVPVVELDKTYTAYLGVDTTHVSYSPLARSQSFIEVTADHPAPTAPVDSTGPIADPTYLPTPTSPSPQYVVKLTQDMLVQTAKVSQADGKWTVDLMTFKTPLPLSITNNGTPVALSFYLPPARAPQTQPYVFVYQSGVEPGSPAGPLTVERALIIDSQGNLLGDTLWAKRPVDEHTLYPLPIWTWSSYKLEVEDPLSHDIQRILLTTTP